MRQQCRRGCDGHAKNLGIAIAFLNAAHARIAAVHCTQVAIFNP
jgi:hypothetical protein